MKIRLINFLIVSVLILFSGCKEKNIKYNRLNFPNVLNLKGIPSNANDLSVNLFSDAGSWFAFSLPPDTLKDYYGAVVGPYDVESKKWLSNKIISIQIYEDDNLLSLSISRYLENNYYPGMLHQKQIVKHISVEYDLIFIKRDVVLIKYTVSNLSDFPRQLSVNFSGKFHHELLEKISTNNNSLLIDVANSDFDYQIDFPDEYLPEIKPKNNTYHCILNNQLYLQPGEQKALNIVIAKHQSGITDNYKYDYKLLEESNSNRWNNYLTILNHLDYKEFNTGSIQRLIVKSIETIITNWRGALGDLHHSGIFPSVSVKYFDGFWAWDSWKHAAALSLFDPGLAKEQILSLFDYQDSWGMIPDVIYLNKEENNWRDSKPPLAAWAVKKYFQATHDTNFVIDIYPKLMKYHYWWNQNRDHDKDGLCEYGSTDGSLIAAKWESGMDDAVRFDSTKILQNGINAFSMDQESVDLNCYLFKEKKILSEFAEITGNNKVAEKLREEGIQLKEKINEILWDKEKNWFFDVAIDGSKFIYPEGPEGWLPLWTEAVDRKRAKLIVNKMMDPEYFNTFVPLPTVSKSSLKYNSGYWRGPVWLDQFYFGIDGMKKYGYDKEANELLSKLLNNSEGLLGNKAIRENYNPENGEGLKARNFSWSAAHLILMFSKNE